MIKKIICILLIIPLTIILTFQTTNALEIDNIEIFTTEQSFFNVISNNVYYNIDFKYGSNKITNIKTLINIMIDDDALTTIYKLDSYEPLSIFDNGVRYNIGSIRYIVYEKVLIGYNINLYNDDLLLVKTYQYAGITAFESPVFIQLEPQIPDEFIIGYDDGYDDGFKDGKTDSLNEPLSINSNHPFISNNLEISNINLDVITIGEVYNTINGIDNYYLNFHVFGEITNDLVEVKDYIITEYGVTTIFYLNGEYDVDIWSENESSHFNIGNVYLIVYLFDGNYSQYDFYDKELNYIYTISEGEFGDIYDGVTVLTVVVPDIIDQYAKGYQTGYNKGYSDGYDSVITYEVFYYKSKNSYTAVGKYPISSPSTYLTFAYNDASILGLDPELFSIYAYEDNALTNVLLENGNIILNKSTYVNAGSGNRLDIFINNDSGYKMTNITIHFGNSDLNTKTLMSLGNQEFYIEPELVINNTLTWSLSQPINRISLKNKTTGTNINDIIVIDSIEITYQSVDENDYDLIERKLFRGDPVPKITNPITPPSPNLIFTNWEVLKGAYKGDSFSYNDNFRLYLINKTELHLLAKYENYDDTNIPPIIITPPNDLEADNFFTTILSIFGMNNREGFIYAFFILMIIITVITSIYKLNIIFTLIIALSLLILFMFFNLLPIHIALIFGGIIVLIFMLLIRKGES